MNLDKKKFTPEEAGEIARLLETAFKKGLLVSREENNPNVLASYFGRGLVSDKWNVKLYAYSEKKKGHSLVTNDKGTLELILDGKYSFPDPALTALKIDDAGWGFPLCGAMVGVTDEIKLLYDIIPVEFFRNDNFLTRAYLSDYSVKGLKLVEKFEAKPRTHRIEICTGFINTMLKDELRKRGFDTRVVEIKGMLQRDLEKNFAEHIKNETGFDLYYDPKEHETREIAKFYRKATNFGRKNCPEKLKSGWNSVGAAMAAKKNDIV